MQKAAVDKKRKKLETIPEWKLHRFKSKEEVILEAQRDKKKVNFATLMECGGGTKITEVQRQSRAPGEITKDDSGAYAVLTEQGSSASEMTAAKIMDVIVRLPYCEGQSADAVSACTQVNLEDAHRLLKIPKSECPAVWIRLPRQMAKIMEKH